MKSNMTKAVFLDRDGTINPDKNYLYRIEDWEFIPGSVEGMKLLFDKDYKLVIVTNQAGIGKGYYRKEDMEKLHNYVISLLKEKNIEIAGIYFCPHDPAENCNCRKPGTAMTEQSIRELNINISESYCVGDKTCDIKMGKDTGCKTILVKTGKGGQDGEYKVEPDFIVEDLLEAAKLIVRGGKK
ncbi:MAG TPA: D-glycero-beta-D-manno-heptose 1,7-bisphosphate 7-phosphatase [Candidatus Eremiobacteraeota bacterium]|nr:MAG: D-glycero-alpha-D-manno-heptose-1,7-bisphosphate 7-phosphatase [bacterium ADurb.Bin363]HPZ07140.1 D-glycero-beta-D-manno-heptose 1,7-bisphosphate 7-phosphatase [Candidatus Eremiobacteraeota bacterium]